MSIAVLVPVLNRPARVAPLVASLEAVSRVIPCAPYFLVTPGDSVQLKAVKASGANFAVMPFKQAPGDYARKMNYGFAMTEEPFVFLGADDLYFHPGWAERAVACWYETGACVVGTNDLGNMRTIEGRHSTHTLVCREYGECGTVDGVELMHEGYWHNYVDDEFVQTAVSRQTYAHATDSWVEHIHPDWGKGAMDSTYTLGKLHFNDDREHFRQRTPLWQRTRR